MNDHQSRSMGLKGYNQYEYNVGVKTQLLDNARAKPNIE